MLGVLGDLLLTAGVVVLLFVGWQLWIGDAIIGAQFKSEAGALTEEWAAAPATPSPSASPDGSGPVEAPALAQPGNGEVFGVLRVPVSDPTTSSSSPGRERLGDPGPHRDRPLPRHRDAGSAGQLRHRRAPRQPRRPFADLPSLRIGDAVVVETPDGWYTYRFRNLEYVRPDGVEVLLPTPQQPEVQATDKLITMTTCSPRYGSTERAIAYGVFESFTPARTDRPRR